MLVILLVTAQIPLIGLGKEWRCGKKRSKIKVSWRIKENISKGDVRKTLKYAQDMLLARIRL